MPRHEAILVVDDEEGLRFTFAMLLRRAGYRQVVTAATFEEAMEEVARRPFACIVSDIVLEGATGLDLLRAVRRAGSQCPVVMITGYPNIDTAAEAVRLGAFDYLPKPVKKSDLLKVVAQAVRHHQEEEARRQRLSAAELESREAEVLVDALPELLLVVDGEDRLLEVNDAARQWLARSFPALRVGGSLADLPPFLSQELRRLVAQARQSGEPLADRLLLVPRGGEDDLCLRAAAGPLAGETRPGAVALSLYDITEARGISFQGMVGKSRAMQRLFATIVSVARAESTVLITGESGTGKELVVEAIHRLSPRAAGPLVRMDCTAIPEDLMESELFGHAKGAFTGAHSRRSGRLAQADGGTLFLDEIGDISPRLQLRLLRFLQERTFYPVGSDQPVQVNVRIIAATNADLAQRIAAGRFRQDLYYRLRVVDVRVPPLREREDDVLLLADHFLRRYALRFQRQVIGFSDAALAALRRYPWPGNVRELEHAVERAVALAGGSTITVDLLPEEIVGTGPGEDAGPEKDGQEVTDDERGRLLRALARTGGNKARAARLLGIDRSTLYRRLAALGIDVEQELQRYLE